MRFLLRTLGLVFLIACLQKPAHAADQPWCIFKTYTDGYADCRYATLQQCLADRLGSGGSCGPSPYPSAPAAFAAALLSGRRREWQSSIRETC